MSEEIPKRDEDFDTDDVTPQEVIPQDIQARLYEALMNTANAEPIVDISTTGGELDEEVAKAPEGPWANLAQVALDADNRNAYDIYCPFCRKSCVMLAGAGQYVDKEIFLMYPNSKDYKDGRVYNRFFKLTSKMDFENITVKKAYATDDFRYLTCGDCEIGPLGITYDCDKNKIFYICHDRILYKSK